MDINAHNMKELANKDSDALKDILEKIHKEALKGNLYLYISDFGVSDNIHRQLVAKGFKVEIGGRYNEVNTSITWS